MITGLNQLRAIFDRYPFVFFTLGNSNFYSEEYGFQSEIIYSENGLIGANANDIEQVLKNTESPIDNLKSSVIYLGYEASQVLSPHLFGASNHSSANKGFPLATYFEAKNKNLVDMDAIIHSMNEQKIGYTLKPDVNYNEFIQKVKTIKEHILDGLYYEANFCISATGEITHQFSPIEVFLHLYRKNKAPFSALLKVNEFYIISSSPERFIRIKQNRISTMPMKGTIRRSAENDADLKLMRELFESEKEQSENLMITDLARNDLAQICKPGTVKVSELFRVIKLPNVYQLISHIEGELPSGTNLSKVLQATFPPGSMTGAPKISVWNHMQQLEGQKRGPFAGLLGLTDNSGSFDSSVIIRSLFYNEKNNSLWANAGSAITLGSEPEAEYNEVMLKLNSLLY